PRGAEPRGQRGLPVGGAALLRARGAGAGGGHRHGGAARGGLGAVRGREGAGSGLLAVAAPADLRQPGGAGSLGPPAPRHGRGGRTDTRRG
ncbi:unnamed protein product, partial [Prorocentrum cordatum]